MLRNVKELKGYTVGASDGELGAVKDVYFDDQRWTIRYVVVETGGWLSSRKVLISPNSVRSVAWGDEILNVNLSRQQVRDSPGIDTDKPVSRQHEIDHYNYFGYPYYWEGANLWGESMFPLPGVGASPDPALDSVKPPDDEAARERQPRLNRERESADSHLRSSNEVIGYEVMATDGPIGSVESFVFDDESWAIWYLVVDTRKWLPGRHVLLSPESIELVSWSDHEVLVSMTRQAIETSPNYDFLRRLSRAHDTRGTSIKSPSRRATATIAEDSE